MDDGHRRRPSVSSPIVAGHVFISYSQRDRDYVHALVTYLRTHGLTVWFDENLHAGTSQWVKSIEVAIEGASAVVPVMSTESDGSVWVDRELDLAQELRKPIVPLLLSGRCFLRLRDRQYADVTGGQMPGGDFILQLTTPAPEVPRPVGVAPPTHPGLAPMAQPTVQAVPTAPTYPPPATGPVYPPPAQPQPYQPPAPTHPPQAIYPPPAPPQSTPPQTPWAHQPQSGYAVPPTQPGLVPVDRAKSWATQSMWWSLAGLCSLFTVIVGWVFAVKALNESRRTGLSLNRAYLAVGLAALITGALVVVVIYTVASGGVSTHS
jgi:hypothetical protein